MLSYAITSLKRAASESSTSALGAPAPRASTRAALTERSSASRRVSKLRARCSRRASMASSRPSLVVGVATVLAASALRPFDCPR